MTNFRMPFFLNVFKTVWGIFNRQVDLALEIEMKQTLMFCYNNTTKEFVMRMSSLAMVYYTELDKTNISCYSYLLDFKS